MRQGLVIEDRYYLYSIFFDITIGAATDEVPYTIKIREMISTATMDSQKYRGITVNFVDIEKLVYKKEVIVHYSPEHQDKVIMIIKPDIDQKGDKFYHIEVEELWNSERIKDSFVITNYIHAQYNPGRRNFNHIDFSVNQYSISVFIEKFRDAVTDRSSYR
ncbi:hypothetical protein [Paenibacillus nasutitermitis]|uniref:Uncharacterized protein n=1 Tax=Paenibacillus nasutitermitis TaxID=1652958 RepID=A0A916ZG97_9BACL|nr:hypothetical protein [Paenibacillus nasutitermitis]GGD94830.1 hypothetical protein GCM10010911_61900 [Paenibacillus nasutitermitis]